MGKYCYWDTYVKPQQQECKKAGRKLMVLQYSNILEILGKWESSHYIRFKLIKNEYL